MIIDFSSVGGGEERNVDLCGECRYFIKISYRNSVPRVAWQTGDKILGEFSREDVKITVRGIKRCKRHGGGIKKEKHTDRRARHEFLRAAERAGIDLTEDIDDRG